MLTLILLYIFYLALRSEHLQAKRKADKKLQDAKQGIVTVATIPMDEGFP